MMTEPINHGLPTLPAFSRLLYSHDRSDACLALLTDADPPRLDQDRMPECLFFQYYGECNNKDCIFLHTRKEDRAKECEWYERGFCKHGPRCRNRHMRKKVCAHYLAGFCPEGPSCPLAHPHFSLPLAQGAVLPGAAGIREQQMAGERFRQCPPVPQQWQQQQAQMMSFTQHQQHMQQLEQMQMMQEQHMWGGGGKPMFY